MSPRERRQRIDAIEREIKQWKERKKNAIAAYNKKIEALEDESRALALSLIEIPT